MMSLKGSKTEKNLAFSFIGESMARNRYTFFAKIAKKQGYEQISEIFTETADNEKEHARLFYEALKKGSSEEKLPVPAIVPLTGLTNTLENLRAAAAGENEEHTDLYPRFADEADKEGFKDVAKIFRSVLKVEQAHEERFNTLAKNVENQTVFKKAKTMKWKCRNCGYVHLGLEAPKVCPVCFHPQAYFQIKEVFE